MSFEFSGALWYWNGPAPFYFVTVPEEQSRDLRATSRLVTYGWGMIPVQARVGETSWRTSLFPKNDRYVVPIKASVRTAERLVEGEEVTLRLDVR